MRGIVIRVILGRNKYFFLLNCVKSLITVFKAKSDCIFIFLFNFLDSLHITALLSEAGNGLRLRLLVGKSRCLAFRAWRAFGQKGTMHQLQEEAWDEEVVNDKGIEGSCEVECSTSQEQSEDANLDLSFSPYATRREFELKLVLRYDSSKVNPRLGQSFFLIDSSWIATWAQFINGERPIPPGPISNQRLYKGDGFSLRDDISPINDYR